MGKAASTMRKAAEASADEAQRKIAARLSMLQEMGEGKVDNFQANVRLDKDPTKFRIGKLLTEYSAINVTSSSDTAKLKTAVSGIVDEVSKGEIGTMIKNVVSLGIDAMVASAKGAVSEKKLYTVRLDGIALQRIDVFMYKYDLTTSGLIQNVDSLFVYAYSISTIGEPITAAALRSLVAINMPGLDAKGQPLPPQEQIAYQLKMYKLLSDVLVDGGDTTASTHVSNIPFPEVNPASNEEREASRHMLSGA